MISRMIRLKWFIPKKSRKHVEKAQSGEYVKESAKLFGLSSIKPGQKIDFSKKNES